MVTSRKPFTIPPRRRRSSQTLKSPTGVWSIRTDTGYLVEGVSESVAWRQFIDYRGNAELLRGSRPVANRNDSSPHIQLPRNL